MWVGVCAEEKEVKEGGGGGTTLNTRCRCDVLFGRVRSRYVVGFCRKPVHDKRKPRVDCHPRFILKECAAKVCF